MQKPKVIIVEGIDRIGKDTLVSNLQSNAFNNWGRPSMHVHYSSPPKSIEGDYNKFEYQDKSYMMGFGVMEEAIKPYNNTLMIYNRFHLGETVYGPRYRGVTEEQVDRIFNIEDIYLDYFRMMNLHPENILLVLLTTSSFDHIEDDGGNFDFSKKEEEQEDFIKAFERSQLNKVRVDTFDKNTGTYRDANDIMQEVLS